MMSRFMRFPCGKPKAVTFSYDDGCMDDMRFSDVIITGNALTKSAKNCQAKMISGMRQIWRFTNIQKLMRLLFSAQTEK